jgi:hypothetical protein
LSLHSGPQSVRWLLDAVWLWTPRLTDSYWAGWSGMSSYHASPQCLICKIEIATQLTEVFHSSV